MREADDGLLARLLWAWPDPIPFRLSRRAPNSAWAIDAFDRLRWLDLQPGDPPQPIMVPLADDAAGAAGGVRAEHPGAAGLGRRADALGAGQGARPGAAAVAGT